MSRNHQNDAPTPADGWLTHDWLESLADVVALRGRDRVSTLLRDLQLHAQRMGVKPPVTVQTPYVNTIAPDDEPDYPGDEQIERRIRSLVRWNAMAMVVRANREHPGVGGHISTYASIATLYEVGFNHFFRGPEHETGPDMVYFQGHATPGNYARAFLEGRLDQANLERFRRETGLSDGDARGLSSYPHPWLMPEFWEFPTVSMGLGPICAIYQARFMRYMQHRGLIEPGDRRVWCFVGDGEVDEPETLAAISLAARERLDNLVFIINCNLQRLDGPVRGNGKIIQELESAFRGVGWNVIKAIWGREWDEVLARDDTGALTRRMGEVVDGQYQKYGVEGGGYIREHFYNTPQLAALVEDKSDEELWKMSYGGHDARKVYAAYRAAFEHEDAPTVILAKTIKGYGLGEAGEGRNVTHQQKKLNEEELLAFRDRFDVPISDEQVGTAPFYRPDDDSEEMRYLHERRKALGGFLPQRNAQPAGIELGDDGRELFKEFHKGSDREAATTMVLVRILAKLLKLESIGERLVPIIPDEARTFGMDALFRQAGIYASAGQLYEPVDAEHLLFYKEAKDGQILEEGITEAGSIASFIAAGTSHVNHRRGMIPFFLFYSMFGFQRIGDLIWQAADSRARGFLVGATAGRTTLNGEGLQHQDGHSHVLALSVPSLRAYDPAFAYEIAVIVEHGLQEMFERDNDVLYYLTVENEPYEQPAMPEGCREGILKGMYLMRAAEDQDADRRVQLLGSGALLRHALRARDRLAEQYDVQADVWSVTSYKALHDDAKQARRWNRLHPKEDPRTPYVTQCLAEAPGPIVAVSDYVKALPDLLSGYVGRSIHALGTDGFGRSDTREALRDHFEVDDRHITLAVLHELMRTGVIEADAVASAIDDLEIDPDRPDPLTR